MTLPRARKVRQRAPWLLLLWAAVSAHAAQISGVQVTREGTRFRIDMRIAIKEPPPAVFRALQDYSAMARFNPDLRSVRVQPTADPGRVRLFTTVHTCVLIFCKLMHQEEVMTATASTDGGTLHADLVSGDFKGGYGQWVVRGCPTNRSVSCMDIRIELVPAFWVPPLIGPWVLRRKMDEEARRTSTGLERTARRYLH